MKVVILDTETTGFEAKSNQIVQLAYLVIINGQVKSKKNFFFTVDKMDKGAENTHGFSIEKLKSLSNGKRFFHHAREIFEDLDESLIVCHNVQFDIPFIQNEFERIGVRINPQNTFCTMIYYTDILKLNGRNGYKWASLKEVLDYHDIDSIEIDEKMNLFFGKVSQAHDARWDIIATMEIYNRIENIQNAIEKVNNKITKKKNKRYRNDNLIGPLTTTAVSIYVLYNMCTKGIDEAVILKASILGWITFIASVYLFGEETNKKSNINSMMDDIGF